MEPNVEEARRAKAFAEKHFMEKDFVGANNYALRAQMLCPELEGISQMVATFAVYIASEAKVNGELDFYSILGLDPSADKPKIKRHYKKMVVLLHPDKNKTVGADGAFRLVSDAWAILSDNGKRSAYNQRRNSFAGYTAGSVCYENSYKFPPSHVRSDTFWTVCTSCHVQYEYLRKYVNKRLSCKNCRGVFIAVETGLAPVNGSFPFCTTTYSYGTENLHAGHGRGVTYVPPASGICPPNGASGHRTGRTTEYVSNISFQSNVIGNSVGVVDTNGLSSSSFVFYQGNGDSNKTKPDKEFKMVKVAGNPGADGHFSPNEVLKPKRGRPSKKIKLGPESPCVNGPESTQNLVVETKKASLNGTSQAAVKLSSPVETSGRRWSAAPAFDTRQFLINGAKSEISLKMKDLKLVSELAAKEAGKRKACANVEKSGDVAKTSTVSHLEQKRSVSMAITVPDSDFHDFDQDRTEECFKPKQIWALYDEEDGMPRLYCLIREVTSLNPFKIFISYLSSRSDTEFGSVNWLDSGFTKSCGSFRVFHSETVDQVNIFSHLLSREKAGRGGCVRIYPRKGDIWAVYRNWSPDWDRKTPDEVRHRYEMVEVLEDYSEENGVWVTPLIKLDGFKTVYRRNMDTNSVRWIPRREMLRFSHQVPASPLKGEGTGLPDGCWDLDPAATPDELLQKDSEIPSILDAAATPDDLRQNENVISDILDPAATPDELRQKENAIPNILDPAATPDELRQKENVIPNINDLAATPDELLQKDSEIPNILDPATTPGEHRQKENEIPNYLDQAATPDEIRQEENEITNNSSPTQMQCESEPRAETEEEVGQRQTFGSMSSFAAIEALFMDEGMFMDVDPTQDWPK